MIETNGEYSPGQHHKRTDLEPATYAENYKKMQRITD